MNAKYHEKKLQEFAISNSVETYDRTELTKEHSDKEIEIEKLIREKYSLSQEIAILRKMHLGKITDEEFKAYSDYVEKCIKDVGE